MANNDHDDELRWEQQLLEEYRASLTERIDAVHKRYAEYADGDEPSRGAPFVSGEVVTARKVGSSDVEDIKRAAEVGVARRFAASEKWNYRKH